MLRNDSQPQSLLGWAAVNSQTTRCAAQSPETAFVSQPGSRVYGNRPAGPEADDNPTGTPLETARRVGDRLPSAFPIHQIRLTARWRKPNGSHQLRGG